MPNQNVDKSQEAREPIDGFKNELILNERRFHDEMQKLQGWNNENQAAENFKRAGYPHLYNLLNGVDAILELTPRMIAMWEDASKDFSVFEQDDAKSLLEDYFNVLSSLTNSFAEASSDELRRLDNDESLRFTKELYDNATPLGMVLSIPMQRTMRVVMPLKEIKKLIDPQQNDYNALDNMIGYIDKLCFDVNQNISSKNSSDTTRQKQQKSFLGMMDIFSKPKKNADDPLNEEDFFEIETDPINSNREKHDNFRNEYKKEEALQANHSPTTLTQLGNVLFDESSGEQYTETLALQGRGQAGLANFYRGPDGKERLIKEDDVATCLMEGTAYYIRDAGLLPGTLGSSVNFATVGTLTKEGENRPSIVSIQDRVMGTTEGEKVRSWDELVYGIKRNPKTLLSFEAWYPGKILENVSCLDMVPKWQLAAGIVASAMAGDESLHVGQFMATVNEDNQIKGIKRIDLGARERYAVARAENSSRDNQDPYHASYFYQKSGQFGKDYVSYLLAEPTLNKMYTMLWMNLSRMPNLDKVIMESSKQAFIQQFEIIPEELRENALEKILETINRLAEFPIVLNEKTTSGKIEELATRIASLDAFRITNMVNKGKDFYTNYLEDMSRKFSDLFSQHKDIRSLCHECILLQRKLILSREFSPEGMEQALDIAEKINEHLKKLFQQVNHKSIPDSTFFKKIQALTELSNDLVHSATLNLQHRPDIFLEQHKKFNEYLDKTQTINDLATYCLETSSTNKIQYVTKAIENALNGRNQLINYIESPELVSKLKEHSSLFGIASNVEGRTKGELLLLKLYKRYHLNDKLVTMTENQRELIHDIKAGNFNKISQYIKNLNIYDATSLDEHNKTALHYLMELGGRDPLSRDIIATFLKYSIGAKENTNLNIADGEGKTPLDYLMANPHLAEIVTAISEKKITGWGGGQYFVKDFFDLENHDKTYKERLDVIPQEPKPQPKSKWWW